MIRFRHIPFLIILNLAALFTTAQSKRIPEKSIISSQMIIMHYNNPRDSFRKPFDDTLNIPVVNNKYPGLKDSLESKLYFGDSLDSVRANFDTCACGIKSMNYKITYEDQKIISVRVYYETEAAYPSSSEMWLTLGINTGRQYPLSAEVNGQGRRWLLNTYKQTLLKRIAHDKATTPDETSDTYQTLKEYIEKLTANELFSKYVFTTTGIVLSINQILPHVINAQEPDEDVFIPYAKLKPYLAPGSTIIKSAR